MKTSILLLVVATSALAQQPPRIECHAGNETWVEHGKTCHPNKSERAVPPKCVMLNKDPHHIVVEGTTTPVYPDFATCLSYAEVQDPPKK